MRATATYIETYIESEQFAFSERLNDASRNAALAGGAQEADLHHYSSTKKSGL